MRPAGAPTSEPPDVADEGPASASAIPAVRKRRRASRPADGDPPAARPAVIADAVRIVAWLSIAAGAIHAVAMVDHFGHYWLYGVFFLVLTYGQVLWGIGALRKPSDARSLRMAAFANLAICAVWLVSRTVGIPFGRYAWQPEAIGVADIGATLDQIVLAAYVAVILRPQLRDIRGFRTLIGRHRMRLGMALCSATVFAALLGAHHHH
jgi:hypothetical protein